MYKHSHFCVVTRMKHTVQWSQSSCTSVWKGLYSSCQTSIYHCTMSPLFYQQICILYLQCPRFHLLPQRTVKLLLGQATHRSDNYFFLPWYAKRNRTVLWFQIVPRKEERATMQEIQGKKGKYDSDETLLTLIFSSSDQYIMIVSDLFVFKYCTFNKPKALFSC